MAWKYNDRIIRVGRSWTNDDGVTHPRNWAVWSDADKTAAGLVWEDDPATYNSDFYWDASTPKALDDVNEVWTQEEIDDGIAPDDTSSGDAKLDGDGNQIVTRGLKYKAIQTAKQQAASKLAETDWHVIKAAEVSDYTVPAAVTTYRAAVRTASNTIETAINGATTHAAFMALYDAPVDSDGNITGNAPINDWPDEI